MIKRYLLYMSTWFLYTYKSGHSSYKWVIHIVTTPKEGLPTPKRGCLKRNKYIYISNMQYWRGGEVTIFLEPNTTFMNRVSSNKDIRLGVINKKEMCGKIKWGREDMYSNCMPGYSETWWEIQAQNYSHNLQKKYLIFLPSIQ